jgi:hypothetical protein
MKRFSIILLVFFTISCGTTKYVPTDTKETIIYKDSIVYVKDTIEVKVPEVKIKEVIPMVDTSYLTTELAESIAYLDTLNREIVHTLEQKGKVEVPIDTLIIVDYLDREVEKEIIKEVEVEVPKYDNLFYFLMVYFIISLLMIISSLVNKD